MPTSQNGYEVFLTARTTGALPRLRKWVIPGTDRHAFLRDGSAGFLLAHVAHWFDQNIEKIGTGTWDEWGWAVRPVRGQTSGYSNHASGTALDVNATQHPRGVATGRTFSPAEVVKIHAQLKVYGGVIRWGGDYTNSPADAMHFEINASLAKVEQKARELWDSPHGKLVLDANPGAASVIWDGKVPAAAKPAPKPAPKPVIPAKPVVKKPTTPPKPAAERLAVDFSYAKVNPAAIKAAGFRGVVRYLSGNPDKDISKAEAKAILDAGLWLLLVWELRANRAGEGKAAGAADAKAANLLADAVGYPRDAAIMYAVDYDADPAAVRDYFAGAHATPGRPVGIYGSARVIDANLAEYAWQTMAWSHGAVSKLAEMVQRTTHSKAIAGAASTDWDENLLVPGKVIPVWNPGEKAFVPTVAKPKPKPVPAPTFRLVETNVLGTNPLATVTAHIQTIAAQADVVVWNELRTKEMQDAVRALPGFASLVAGEVGISWRTSVLEAAGDGVVTKVNPGVLHVTPTRNILTQPLRHLASGKVYRQKGGHSVQHVESGGKALIKGQILGQNTRAKVYFATLAAELKADALLGPVVFSGDLNVNQHAEESLPAADRTPWFPLTVLGAVGTPHDVAGGTHAGGRWIDWLVTAGPVQVANLRTLEPGSSDHRPVAADITL